MAKILAAFTIVSTFISASSMTIITKDSGAAVLSPTGDIVTARETQQNKMGVQADGSFRQLTNGSTPTGWIQVGTPKKWLYVIFDTGSDKLVAKTWESVASELSSIDQGVDGMFMPSEKIYNHETSTSYHRKLVMDPETKKEVPKQSSITYGSGSAITDEGTETVLVGNRNLSNYTIMEITQDSLQLLHTSKGIAGVLGLQHMKNKSLGNSLFSRMRDAGLLTSFGYCRDNGNNGTFIWADQTTEGHEMEVVGQMHWAVKLGDVHVDVNITDAKKPASLFSKRDEPSDANEGDDATIHGVAETSDGKADVDDVAWNEFGGDGSEEEISDPAADMLVLKDTCANNSCTAILDTGSNIIAGPSSVMKSITSLVNVKPDCSNFDTLPVITMNFGGLPVKIHPSGYVMKVPMPEGGMGGMGGGGDGEHEGGLSEKHASSARAATGQRWKEVFDRLYKNYDIDLRDAVRKLVKQVNSTVPEFLCMSALVPLDKHTSFGPLYVVGTPLLDAYYARWSFEKNATSPKIHLQALEDANVCKFFKENDHLGDSVPGLMRRQTTREVVTSRIRNRGPTERFPEEIAYPHWARSLLHV
jgi:hypothetical protein